MAKRFTDTDKWKKPFIRGLQAPYKLLWIYILDDCDHAGIWQVDIQVAQIRIGEKITVEDALKNFGDRVIEISESKWFILDFIEFQYNGKLNPADRVHASVIAILEKNGIDINLINKALASPLNGAKVKDKVKVKDKDKVKEEEKEEVVLPFDSENFNEQWQVWKDYKKKEHKFNFRSAGSEQASLIELSNLSGGDEAKAIQIIHQSMANGWKGFFEIKNNVNGKTAPKIEWTIDDLR